MLTAKNIYDLNNMNVAAQNVNLGTTLSELESSLVPTISALTNKQIHDLNNMNVVTQNIQLGAILDALVNGDTSEIEDLTEGQIAALNNINVAAQKASLGTVLQSCINSEVSRYLLTVTVNDESMGSATGGGLYEANTPVVLTATPNEGYEFVNWTDGEAAELSTDNPYNTTTVAQAETIMANFQAVTPEEVVEPV